MAEVAEEVVVQKPGWKAGLLASAVTGLVAGALGFSVPLLFPSLVGFANTSQEVTAAQPSFVPFGSVVVNLNEGRLNRYLRVSITLEVSGGQEVADALSADVAAKKSVLVDWLLSYLGDMSMDSIRGAAGQNRLRREIQDHFNWVLFPEGKGQIDDVLFEEFNIQ